jgi:hypothetical protein
VLNLVARKGDVVRLGPGKFGRIGSLTSPVVGKGGQDGRGTSVNDSSRVLFRAAFDGTDGAAILRGEPPPQWGVDASGDFSNMLNWRGDVPGALVDHANFFGKITLPRTVTVDDAFALACINFNDDNSYTIAGDGVSGHGLELIGVVDNPSIIVSQGTHTISSSLRMADDTDVAIAPSFTGSAIELSGLVTLAASTTMTKTGVAAFTTGTLTLNGSLDLGASSSVVVRNGTMNISLIGASSIGSGVSYTVDSGATLSAGGLVDPFAGTSSVANNGVFQVLAGTKHVTLINGTGTSAVAPGATLEVGSNGPVGQSNFTVNGFADVGSVSVANFVTVGNGTVAASLSAKHIRAGSLQIQDMGVASIKLDGTADATSKVGTLVIGGVTDAWTGKLDLADNDLVIDYTGASPLATVQNQIASAYNGGSWNGNGIASSAGDVSTYGLAYAEADALGLGTFSGQSVDDTAVLVKYSYYGDSDLDGDVDIGDLGNLASNWQMSGEWIGGDFDYNGTVNVNDLGLLASNWQAGVGSPLGPGLAAALAGFGLPGSTVPEPQTAAIVLASGLALRRRSRCHMFIRV